MICFLRLSCFCSDQETLKSFLVPIMGHLQEGQWAPEESTILKKMAKQFSRSLPFMLPEINLAS